MNKLLRLEFQITTLLFNLFYFFVGSRILGPLHPPYGNTDLDFKRICIFPNWSVLRESAIGRILPEDIDPYLCTHIHYAYANIDVKNLQLTPSQFQDYNHGDHGAV